MDEGSECYLDTPPYIDFLYFTYLWHMICKIVIFYYLVHYFFLSDLISRKN